MNCGSHCFLFFLKDPKRKSVIFLGYEFLKDEVVFTCFYTILMFCWVRLRLDLVLNAATQGEQQPCVQCSDIKKMQNLAGR